MAILYFTDTAATPPSLFVFVHFRTVKGGYLKGGYLNVSLPAHVNVLENVLKGDSSGNILLVESTLIDGLVDGKR
jgi:hypothetical protein